MLQRSLLFLPATRAVELLPKAARSGADAIVIDLEDAVSSGDKQSARSLLVQAASMSQSPVPLVVRTNPVGHEDFALDVRAALAARVAAIMLPKVRSPGDVEHLSIILDAAEAGARPAVPVRILALIESAVGVLAVREIATSGPRLASLALGGEDLAADIGVPRTKHGLEIQHARGALVLAAAAAGVAALDTPCMEIGNLGLLRRDSIRSRSMGFRGRLAVHPDQVPVINEAFSPSAAEVQAAKKVLQAFAEDRPEGSPALAVSDGRLIDEPVARVAAEVLRRTGSQPQGRDEKS